MRFKLFDNIMYKKWYFQSGDFKSRVQFYILFCKVIAIIQLWKKEVTGPVLKCFNEWSHTIFTVFYQACYVIKREKAKRNLSTCSSSRAYKPILVLIPVIDTIRRKFLFWAPLQ